MAQLYKMTLYICDLEGNLTLDEIKTLISDRALDGVSISAITKFKDEKIGPQIEWHDDIDLNKTDSTVETWERYFKQEETTL